MNTGTPASAASCGALLGRRGRPSSRRRSAARSRPGASSSSLVGGRRRRRLLGQLRRAGRCRRRAHRRWPSTRRARGPRCRWSSALAVERRLRPRRRRAAERDQPDLDVGVDLVDEVAGRLLARRRAGRVDVGRHHRQRHVEQHEDAALALGALGRRRSTGRAMATTPAARPSSCSAGDDVAAPAGPARRDAVEQVDLGEAHRGRVGASAARRRRRRRGRRRRAATTAARGSRKLAITLIVAAPGR